MSDILSQLSRKLPGKLVASYEPVVAPRPHAPTHTAEEADVAACSRSPLAPGESVRDHIPRVTVARQRAAEDKSDSRYSSAADGEGEALRDYTPTSASPAKEVDAPESVPSNWLLKRGHALTFGGLFLFTFVLYFRPYELIPALSSLTSIAFWIAVATLLVFIPTQLGLEGNLTARPREINLVLLLTLTALLSIPLATDRSVAWGEFSGSFIKVIIMFIVMVNVVRTEGRLKSLLWLAFAVSCFLCYHAIKDFGSLTGTSGTERVWGAIGGAFGNPNDLALHLATMVPLAVALLFSTRNLLAKPLYFGLILLMTAGIVVTFSRGGVLGLAAACIVFGWKAGRNHRFLVITGGLLLLAGFLAVAPGNYLGRLASVYDQNLDTGSVSARSALFWRSLYVTAANPIFGVGMGNFSILGISNQVSHNAYTQVSAEMGLAALAFYLLFIIVPFKRLLHIEVTTDRTSSTRRLHFLAIGLQASLVAYAVSSFFGSVAYIWYVYYLVGYALCLDRLHAMHIAREQTPT
jgi:O-antigen ligase